MAAVGDQIFLSRREVNQFDLQLDTNEFGI